MNFILKELNKPWVSQSYGPDSFDCWGFIYYMLRQHKNIEIDSYQYIDAHNRSNVNKAFSNPSNKSDWIKLQKPVDFSVILMGRNNYPTHCGLYFNIDGGVIVHCSERNGVEVVTVSNLYEQLQMKPMGFYLHRDLL